MCSTKTAPFVVQAQPGTSFFTYDPASINDMHHPSHQNQHCWRPFPPAFMMRRAFVEELKKTPSNQSWKTPASQHQKIQIPTACTPSLFQGGLPSPSCQSWLGSVADTLATCPVAGKAGVRRAGTWLAGGVTNPWQSTKPKAILKSATSIWQVLWEPPRRSCAALWGRMQELGSGVGTSCSAGRTWCKPQSLIIDTSVCCLVHHGSPSS